MGTDLFSQRTDPSLSPENKSVPFFEYTTRTSLVVVNHRQGNRLKWWESQECAASLAFPSHNILLMGILLLLWLIKL